MTRGSDNKRNLLCAWHVFPNGPRHVPALLFSGSLHIRQCHTLYSTMLLSKVLCTIRHRRTRGTFQHRTTMKRPPGIPRGRITLMLVHPWDAPNHDDEWRAVL